MSPNSSWHKWNEGTMNFGGRSIFITEQLISRVTKILIVGRKFYRDRKFSDATIDDFPKELAESEAFVKQEGQTYFQPGCIKKLWRFVLRAIIYYVTLEGRFSWICSQHFV